MKENINSKENNIRNDQNNENIINPPENQDEPNNNINMEDNDNINKNNEQNISFREKLLSECGFYANINGEDFDPREVTVLSGDEKNREITQIMKFLCDSYPIEAITYCLRRCYYNTFSHTSILDKIIKYLLEKYKDNGEETITNIIYSYKENMLNIDISTVNEFNSKNQSNFGNNELHMTKLVFYDYSKEDVIFRKLIMNEVFIELDSKFINNDNLLEKENKNEGLSLEENDAQATFLGDKHHLFKRFCRRKGNIYVFNFIGFENRKVLRKPNKKKKKYKKDKEKEKEENEKEESVANFKCEIEGCPGIYTYNFNSNRFTKKMPHSIIPHDIKNDVPEYYQENIKLLKEKIFITDIQLVRVGD